MNKALELVGMDLNGKAPNLCSKCINLNFFQCMTIFIFFYYIRILSTIDAKTKFVDFSPLKEKGAAGVA